MVEWFRCGTPTRVARDHFPVLDMHNLTDYKLVESVPLSLNVKKLCTLLQPSCNRPQGLEIVTRMLAMCWYV